MDVLVKALAGRGVAVGLLTGLDSETAGALAERVGLADAALLRHSWNEKVRHNADAWARLAARASVPIRRGVAVAAGAAACRGAIAAGLRCVAVPDALSAFQDFGGADLVLETLADSGAEQILGLLDAS
jgi:hypothetical protein